MGLVNRLTTLVPNNPAKPTKLVDAVAGEPKLQEAIETEPGVDKLVEIAKRLGGPAPSRLDARGRRGDRGPAAATSSCRSTATRRRASG